ncbi:MAG: hypothetical protein ACE5JA_09305, partial [bacterium]
MRNRIPFAIVLAALLAACLVFAGCGGKEEPTGPGGGGGGGGEGVLSWATISPLSSPRRALAVAAAGGKIYAIGGIDSLNSVVGDVEEWDPAT